jgi:hypothetical protein
MSAKVVRRGIFLIGIGVVLLFNNIGLLGWDVWYDLLRFWPILLICFGLERVFRESRLSALAYLSPLVLAFTFVGVMYYQGFSKEGEDFDTWEYEGELHRWVVDDEGPYTGVRLNIDFGVGSLWLKEGEGALLSAKFNCDRDPPRCRYEEDDGEASIKIRSEEHRFSIFSRKHRNEGRIEVSGRYPLDLRLDVGACDLDLDLSELQLADLVLDGGVCNIDLRFGDRSEHLRVNIDVGVSDLDIEIPEGVGLKVTKDTALSSFNHRGIRLAKRSGSTYLSEDYTSAEKRIDLHLDAGVSSVVISKY